MINKLFLYYFKFRTLKLNFIEYIILNLVEKISEWQLYILYYIKLCFGEDIANLSILNENNEYESIYVYKIIGDISMIKLLWKCKYKGFDISSFNETNETDKFMIFFQYHKRHYILYIDLQMLVYYYYDIISEKTNCINNIEFGQIKLCL